MSHHAQLFAWVLGDLNTGRCASISSTLPSTEPALQTPRNAPLDGTWSRTTQGRNCTQAKGKCLAKAAEQAPWGIFESQNLYREADLRMRRVSPALGCACHLPTLPLLSSSPLVATSPSFSPSVLLVLHFYLLASGVDLRAGF